MIPNRFVWYFASFTAASTASVPELAKNVFTPPVMGTISAHRLGQLHLRLVVEVRARHVQVALRLIDDGLDHVGVRVPRRR